jgi:hypothetical protein
MKPCPIDSSPWRYFADYYFAGTPIRRRVSENWGQYEARYESVLQKGDPIADSLAQAIIDRRVSRADFELALTRGIDAVRQPDSTLREFFAHVDQLPDGIDMAAVDRGSAVLKQLPITVLLTHGIVAGFVFAAINPNSAIPLSLNQSIARATRRRYIETTKYVADTIATGGLQRFGGGFQSACRVRLVHAFVRTEIVRHYDWNFHAYGAPIHPVALIAAAAVPDVWAVRFAEKHGCRFSDRDLQDVAAHNARLAYLHGVPIELIPTDYESFCDVLCWAICQSALPLPEDRAAALSVLQPLLENGYPLSTNAAINWFFNQTVYTASRSILGDTLCDAYDIPTSRQSGPLSVALAGINRMLVAAQRLPATRSIYRRGTSLYWNISVPRLVEKITGQSQVSYATTVVHRSR